MVVPEYTTRDMCSHYWTDCKIATPYVMREFWEMRCLTSDSVVTIWGALVYIMWFGTIRRHMRHLLARLWTHHLCLSFPLRMRARVWMVFSTILVTCYILVISKHKIIPISCRTQQLIAYHYIDIIDIITNCCGLLFARLTVYTTKTSNDVNMFAVRCPFLIRHNQL